MGFGQFLKARQLVELKQSLKSVQIALDNVLQDNKDFLELKSNVNVEQLKYDSIYTPEICFQFRCGIYCLAIIADEWKYENNGLKYRSMSPVYHIKTNFLVKLPVLTSSLPHSKQLNLNNLYGSFSVLEEAVKYFCKFVVYALSLQDKNFERYQEDLIDYTELY